MKGGGGGEQEREREEPRSQERTLVRIYKEDKQVERKCNSLG